MAGWILWAVLAGACAIGEMMTGALYLAPFAVGAGLAAIGEAAAGTAVAVIVFVVASVGTLLALRPISRAHRSGPPAIRTGAAALIGKRAIVIERIANNDGVGIVKIDGEVWTARSLYDDEEIDAGKRVEVIDIKGATALVIE
ncbi:MAG: NfeD family protein [Solirubrobacteraceae bacterium]